MTYNGYIYSILVSIAVMIEDEKTGANQASP